MITFCTKQGQALTVFTFKPFIYNVMDELMIK